MFVRRVMAVFVSVASCAPATQVSIGRLNETGGAAQVRDCQLKSRVVTCQVSALIDCDGSTCVRVPVESKGLSDAALLETWDGTSIRGASDQLGLLRFGVVGDLEPPPDERSWGEVVVRIGGNVSRTKVELSSADFMRQTGWTIDRLERFHHQFPDSPEWKRDLAPMLAKLRMKRLAETPSPSTPATPPTPNVVDEQRGPIRKTARDHIAIQVDVFGQCASCAADPLLALYADRSSAAALADDALLAELDARINDITELRRAGVRDASSEVAVRGRGGDWVVSKISVQDVETLATRMDTPATTVALRLALSVGGHQKRAARVQVTVAVPIPGGKYVVVKGTPRALAVLAQRKAMDAAPYEIVEASALPMKIVANPPLENPFCKSDEAVRFLRGFALPPIAKEIWRPTRDTTSAETTFAHDFSPRMRALLNAIIAEPQAGLDQNPYESSSILALGPDTVVLNLRMLPKQGRCKAERTSMSGSTDAWAMLSETLCPILLARYLVDMRLMMGRFTELARQRGAADLALFRAWRPRIFGVSLWSPLGDAVIASASSEALVHDGGYDLGTIYRGKTYGLPGGMRGFDSFGFIPTDLKDARGGPSPLGAMTQAVACTRYQK